MGMPLRAYAGCVHSTDKSFNSPDRIGIKVGDEIEGDAGYCAVDRMSNTAGNSSTL